MPSIDEQISLIGSWLMKILKGVFSLLDTLFTAILLLISTLFFIWVNQKQDELDDLRDKPKKN
jgi:hypothetical protein